MRAPFALLESASQEQASILVEREAHAKAQAPQAAPHASASPSPVKARAAPRPRHGGAPRGGQIKGVVATARERARLSRLGFGTTPPASARCATTLATVSRKAEDGG